MAARAGRSARRPRDDVYLAAAAAEARRGRRALRRRVRGSVPGRARVDGGARVLREVPIYMLTPPGACRAFLCASKTSRPSAAPRARRAWCVVGESWALNTRNFNGIGPLRDVGVPAITLGLFLVDPQGLRGRWAAGGKNDWRGVGRET